MIIRIKNLRVRTIIGVHDWEQKAPRELLLNLSLHYDAARPARSDAIADAVDYHAVSQLITTHVAARRYRLLEKMASELADLLMQDTRITGVKLEIDKAGVIENADSVSIEHSRAREHEIA